MEGYGGYLLLQLLCFDCGIPHELQFGVHGDHTTPKKEKTEHHKVAEKGVLLLNLQVFIYLIKTLTKFLFRSAVAYFIDAKKD